MYRLPLLAALALTIAGTACTDHAPLPPTGPAADLIPSSSNSARAPEAAKASKDVRVEIMKHADLINGGKAVRLEVRVGCRLEGVEVLEAFVTVSQERADGMASLPVRCARQHWQQKHTVEARSWDEDARFVRGTARASAYVLLLDPETGATRSGSDTREIRIR